MKQVLSSAFSSGNACTFLASRTLHGLALDGHAPSIFLEINRFGIPYVAVAASVVWGLVAYSSLNQGSFKVIFIDLLLKTILISSGVFMACLPCHNFRYHFVGNNLCNLSSLFLRYEEPEDISRHLAI